MRINLDYEPLSTPAVRPIVIEGESIPWAGTSAPDREKVSQVLACIHCSLFQIVGVMWLPQHPCHGGVDLEQLK